MAKPTYWLNAQRNELAIWEATAGSGPMVLAELAEVGQLIEFGQAHGITAAARVLELGVGPLAIGWGALTRAADVTVVDPLPRLAIRTGDPMIDDLGHELQRRSTYLQRDATEPLDLPEASFDLVVCDNVIDHSQQPDALLLEAHRLAEPAGRLLFGVNAFSLLGIVKWRYVYRPAHRTEANVVCHPQSFVESGVRKILERCGWDVTAWGGALHLQLLFGKAYRVRAVARKR